MKMHTFYNDWLSVLILVDSVDNSLSVNVYNGIIC